MLTTLALVGCTQNPPLQSNNNWHESGVVRRDLAAQLVNPADLAQGHGDTTVPAQAFVAAANSWYTAQSATSGAPSSSAFSGGAP